MKKEFVFVALALAILVTGCTQPQVSNPQTGNPSNTLPPAQTAGDSGPSQEPTCLDPGSQFAVTKQSMSTTGWEIELSNISGRAMQNLAATASSRPVTENGSNLGPPPLVEPVPIGSEPGTGNTTIVPQSLEPGQKAILKTTETFEQSKRYTTAITVSYSDSDGMSRTIGFNCNGS